MNKPYSFSIDQMNGIVENTYTKIINECEYLKKNFTANICSNVSETTKDADLIIISAPLSSYKEILLSIKSTLKEGSILTDTGSAKKEVNKNLIIEVSGINPKEISKYLIKGIDIISTSSSITKSNWIDLSMRYIN